MKLSDEIKAQLPAPKTVEAVEIKEEKNSQASWDKFIENMKAKGALISNNGHGQTKIKF